MAGRGVHFALGAAQEELLLAAQGDDEAVMEIVEQIEEAWDSANLMETDKTWDALHRCFCDGKLLYEGGSYPLNHLICGGRQLLCEHDADGTVTYVSAAQVKDVAREVAMITRDALRLRYGKIKQRGYEFRLGDEDFDYVWSNFEDLVRFFAAAARDERAVLFTVDA